jgi:hypothetical protein
MLYSCRKIKNYFHDPETKIIGQNIQASYAIAYSANIALTEMTGYHVPNVTFTRSNPGYPCTSLSVVNANNGDPFLNDKIGKITIAGLWADADDAVFTILFTDFNFTDSKFSLLGINTFPLIRQNGKTIVAYGAMDIDLNPGPDAMLTLDLSNQEIESEYSRMNEERPNDLYVAVEENGYFIDINDNNSMDDISDDTYSITGGGQVIEITNTTAGIYQQAMIGVEISSFCLENPTKGYALLKKMRTRDNKLPELGTVIFEFNESCSGLAKITLATGIYIGSNDKSVAFEFK